MKRIAARVTTTAVVGVIAVAASASPAAAAQRPTPNGLCGAKNMVNENARPHMVAAMTYHTNEHGDQGMARAVTVSSC